MSPLLSHLLVWSMTAAILAPAYLANRLAGRLDRWRINRRMRALRRGRTA